jgi:protein tyrosine/serine phosphatase
VAAILLPAVAPEHRPVFVHCRRSKARMGVVIACYRMRAAAAREIDLTAATAAGAEK